MWTPKRIVMLSACFLAFFTLYLSYAYTSVGRIDGLPPLPELYWPDPTDSVLQAPPRGESKLAIRLKQAFGPECKELKWAIRLDLNSRSMVLAAEQFQVASDGRVCLAPISVAVFGKTRDPRTGAVEINTIRGEVAYLKFDRPVTNFSEVGSRKIVEAELTGQIEITSNRRRPQRDEDLHVRIPIGPLYYREATHRIWTHDYVTLTDHKSKPRPHVVKGKGMEMELLVEGPANKPGPQKQKSESISGVKWVQLHSAVDMHLYIDGKSGLFAGNDAPKKPAPGQPAPAKPADAGGTERKPDRAYMHITTPGRFRYELYKDHDLARFDCQPAEAAQSNRQPHHVDVIRFNETQGTTDHLICEQLTLRLRRRDKEKEKETARATGKPMEAGESVDIETVHATSSGRNVVLTSDAERLTARGNDFFHDALKKQTILKGVPELEMDKDDSKIYARELHIQDVTPPPVPGKPPVKTQHRIEAQGPGRIHMIDRKEKKTLHAYWKTLLTSVRENDQDVLTLTGQAQFIDEATEQSLKGDVLKVWLEEIEGKKASPADTSSSSRRPRHLEATGNVVARSREFNIHDTNRLVVWFKDVPASAHLPPPGSPAAAKPAPPAAGAATRPPDRRAAGVVVPGDRTGVPAAQPPRPLPAGPATADPVSKAGGRPGATGPALPGQDAQAPARPFDLSGRSVEARVLRSPIKNSIDELWCEGSVHVRQDPARAEEKGTEIHGDTLKATAGTDGGFLLVVTGDLAQLQTDKIYIIGPEVNIDQTTNKAWVYGDGAMKMESATNFQGEKLERPVPLTVHWSKSMLFNGNSAEFHGNIQAVQEKARLACQHLQVYFDRTISLRQGNKSDQPARVRTLVCDRDVRVEESSYVGDKLVKYQRLEGPAVEMRALEPEESRPARPVPPGGAPAGKEKDNGNVVYASGPGNVRVMELGQEDPVPATGAGPRPPARKTPADAAASKDAEMKMTYVTFQNRMDANSQKHLAYFWGNVRVLNFPCNRHDIVIDLDIILAADLPEKAVYMRCDRLKVLDALVDGKPNKEMWAYGKVYVQGREFYARAGTVTYNQAKEQVIFHGEDGGYATMYRVDRPGAKPHVIEAKKIIYHRSTGKVDVISTRSATGD